MVHLNGRALPDYSQNIDTSSSSLFDDLRHIDTFKSKPDDDRAEDLVRRHEPVSNASDPMPRQSSSPRRPRPSATARGPRPLLPRSLKEALQLAELLAKSKLIPKGFDTPETCLVGILYGMEVGLSPIAALQRMAVIDGRPTIWGDAALALVQSSGLLHSIREEIIEDEDTKILTAICRVEREGRPEPVTGTFSVDDAKRAGLWQKPGPWTDYPKRMLTMRARAFALRDAFPDVLAGLYIREEFEGSKSKYGSQSSVSHDNTPHDRGDASPEDTNWERSEAEPRFRQTNINQPHQNKDLANWAVRKAPPPPPDISFEEGHAGRFSDRANANRTVKAEGHAQENKTAVVDLTLDNDARCSDHLKPEILLDLFDSALCCALDLPTLEEIVDEFAERLQRLTNEAKQRSQRTIERHRKRVAEINRSPATGVSAILETKDVEHDEHDHEAESGDAPTASQLTINGEPSALPRGLKPLLSTLGLGRTSLTGRRRKRSDTKSRSLASWYARTRLSNSKEPAVEDEITLADEVEREE